MSLDVRGELNPGTRLSNICRGLWLRGLASRERVFRTFGIQHLVRLLDVLQLTTIAEAFRA